MKCCDCVMIVLALNSLLWASTQARNIGFQEFAGGSECFIRNRQFSNEFLYPVNKFTFGFSIHRTVCLKSINQVDLVEDAFWQIVRVDHREDTFFLKTRQPDEYLCSVIGFFDGLTKRHEMRRVSDPSGEHQENCEWQIESNGAEDRDEPVLYVIKNLAHNEPILAEPDFILSTSLKRNVYLKHEKSKISRDNYNWIIDCE
jgi:hypothetical protein